MTWWLHTQSPCRISSKSTRTSPPFILCALKSPTFNHPLLAATELCYNRPHLLIESFSLSHVPSHTPDNIPQQSAHPNPIPSLVFSHKTNHVFLFLLRSAATSTERDLPKSRQARPRRRCTRCRSDGRPGNHSHATQIHHELPISLRQFHHRHSYSYPLRRWRHPQILQRYRTCSFPRTAFPIR